MTREQLLEKVREMVGGLDVVDRDQVVNEVVGVIERVGQQEHRGLIPISRAMELTGKSRNTIKGWVQRKLLDGYQSRTSGEWFVPEYQLRELVELSRVHGRMDVPRDFSPSTDFKVGGDYPKLDD